MKIFFEYIIETNLFATLHKIFKTSAVWGKNG